MVVRRVAVVVALLSVAAAKITPIPPITTSAFPSGTSQSQFTTAVSSTESTDCGRPIGGSIFTTVRGSTAIPTLPLSCSILSSGTEATSSGTTSTATGIPSNTNLPSITSSDTSVSTTAVSSASLTTDVPTTIQTTPALPSPTTSPSSSAVLHSQGSFVWPAVIGLFLVGIMR